MHHNPRGHNKQRKERKKSITNNKDIRYSALISGINPPIFKNKFFDILSLSNQ